MHLYLPNAIQLSTIVPRPDYSGRACLSRLGCRGPRQWQLLPLLGWPFCPKFGAKQLLAVNHNGCCVTPNFRQKTGPGGLPRATFHAEALVELTGIEPVTPCLQSRCSPS